MTRNPWARYDEWKTSPPEEPDAPEGEELSNCCGVPRDPRYPESDFCPVCHEHTDFEFHIEEVAPDDDGGLYDTTRERDEDR